jgi:hypothetical protein
MTVAASAHSAIGECKKDEARVCEYLDHMQLCAQGLNAKDHGNQGWFGDHGKASRGNSDDEYGTWNRNSCNSNTDGPAKHYFEKMVYSCCRGAAGVTPACPAATKAMSTKNGEVCASDMQRATNVHTAIKDCFGKGGHICTHGDMFQLAGNGHNPWYAGRSGGNNGWYGDHGFASGGNVDNEYMTWNRNHYTPDNDGPAYHWNAKNLPYRCCSGTPGTVCPAGFTLVGAQCMKNTKSKKTYYSAQDTCKASSAHICSHGEMMEMCANGANPYSGVGDVTLSHVDEFHNNKGEGETASYKGHTTAIGFKKCGSGGSVYSKHTFTGTKKITFDFAGKEGGFMGYSAGTPGAHVWPIATQAYGNQHVRLETTGEWKTYTDTWTCAYAQCHIMLEDWSGSGGSCGNVYFDNFVIY